MNPPLCQGLLLVLTPVYTCWVKRCASFMSSFAKISAALGLLYYLADTDCSPSPRKKKTEQKMTDGSPRRRCISPPLSMGLIMWRLGEWGGSFRKFMPNATFPVKKKLNCEWDQNPFGIWRHRLYRYRAFSHAPNTFGAPAVRPGKSNGKAETWLGQSG